MLLNIVNQRHQNFTTACCLDDDLRAFPLITILSTQKLSVSNQIKQFKVDRLQIIVVAKNITVLQLFISRMPKMCAIPQLVSAPLNPIPTVEHFRRTHPRLFSSSGYVLLSLLSVRVQYSNIAFLCNLATTIIIIIIIVPIKCSITVRSVYF